MLTLQPRTHEPSPAQRVWYGPGCVEHLADEVRSHGGRRVCVIASNTLATKTDVVEQVVRQLGELSAGVFHDVHQHVHRESVLLAADFARARSADFIVSVGGGTPIDCGKAVQMCLTAKVETPEDLTRLLSGPRVPLEATESPIRAHVTISTTLSAGEFTAGLGITDPQRQVKEMYGDSSLMPVAAFLDPNLTVPTPQWLWLSTGIRAVDHAVEAYLSPRANPVTDALSFAALTDLNVHLRRSFSEPEDIDARARSQVAAFMSIAHSRNAGFGVSHSIGHQLGGRCDVPHGYTSCIVLPHVMDFDLPVSKARQAKLAGAFGLDPAKMTEDEGAQAFIVELRDLIASLEVPTTLSAVGVREEDFADIAREAANEGGARNNPRPATEQDIIAILEAAY